MNNKFCVSESDYLCQEYDDYFEIFSDMRIEIDELTEKKEELTEEVQRLRSKGKILMSIVVILLFIFMITFIL